MAKNVRKIERLKIYKDLCMDSRQIVKDTVKEHISADPKCRIFSKLEFRCLVNDYTTIIFREIQKRFPSEVYLNKKSLVINEQRDSQNRSSNNTIQTLTEYFIKNLPDENLTPGSAVNVEQTRRTTKYQSTFIEKRKVMELQTPLSMQTGIRIKYPNREEIYQKQRKPNKKAIIESKKRLDESSRTKNSFKLYKGDDIRYTKLQVRLTDYELDRKCCCYRTSYTWRSRLSEEPQYTTQFTPVLLTKANWIDGDDVLSVGEISDEDCENQATKADLQKNSIQEKTKPSSGRSASRIKSDKKTKKRVRIDYENR
ncbi:DgyrCDS3466 [Dimorphilus gyrociliatus]|uniref:DgyrCDS3466 n=1 Tax=Dimorphilus gyrociliatus TaxID=2664684 RepID=A0A7I8VF84_9ANNE|nr:DgyrCDS3466 [Dimorphilus gyrociliatus]